MTGFRVDADPLYANGQDYGLVHAELSGIFSRLTQALAAAGPFWGGDESGQYFAARYCPAAVGGLEQMGATADGVQSLIDGVCNWAKNYVNVDGAVAHSTPTTD